VAGSRTTPPASPSPAAATPVRCPRVLKPPPHVLWSELTVFHVLRDHTAETPMVPEVTASMAKPKCGMQTSGEGATAGYDNMGTCPPRAAHRIDTQSISPPAAFHGEPCQFDHALVNGMLKSAFLFLRWSGRGQSRSSSLTPPSTAPRRRDASPATPSPRRRSTLVRLCPLSNGWALASAEMLC
jgi:hypothetical protein